MDIDVTRLKKIPQEPAARLLSRKGTKLAVKHDLPPSASVADLVAELARRNEAVALLRLLAVALPPREAVWWACLAAEEIVRAEGQETRTLKTAKAWVQRPDHDAYHAVTAAMETAEIDDETVLCATAAHWAAGSIDLKEGEVDPTPPAGVGGAVAAQIAQALRASDLPFAQGLDYMIRRGLDIAAGGTGQVPRPTPAPSPEETG